MNWFPGGRLLVALCLVGVILAACVRPDPPSGQPSPTWPVITPISQCKEVFPTTPGGYTRPVPTNHSIIPLPSLTDYAGIKAIWLDRNCGVFYLGPLDYRYPNTNFCAFHPELGDRIYSGQDGFIIPIPAPCDGQPV